jgi:hypothetical protein
MKLTVLLLALPLTAVVQAQVTFLDATAGSGIDHVGKTYGSSWGDLNGDGLLDIYVSNHYNTFDDLFGGYFVEDVPKVYINQGDGHFSDSLYIVDPTEGNDLHGALIFDFDDDGDNDLLITSGGHGRNLFYVNDGSPGFLLSNSSLAYNIDFDQSRGRMASVLDLDRNGVPDVVLSSQANADNSQPTSVFTRQNGSPFELANTDAGFDVPVASHGTLMDMDNDSVAEFVLMQGSEIGIYDVHTGAFNTVGSLSISGSTTDHVLGDFNGDLLTDVFLTKAKVISTYISQPAPQLVQVDAQVGPSIPGTTTLSFACEDSLQIGIRDRRTGSYDFNLHFGSDSVVHLTGYQSLTLHPSDAFLQGMQPLGADLDGNHIYFGRVDGQWQVQVNNQLANGELGISLRSTSVPITDLLSVYPELGGTALNEVRMNTGGFGFMSVPVPGLLDTDNSQMGVAGDFDNDMDLDIYVLCSTGALNASNYLLENLGGQGWQRHDDAWGAPGTVNGIGDAVTVADQDNDGFLDLLVSNGMSVFFLDSARYTLYANQGNANHWLGIDLVGGMDTRGGYGAVVYAVAGGVKQVRTKNGGEHHRSQNDQRIHFGMGPNTMVDSIIVKWPCGLTQVLTDVPADQYVVIQQTDCTVGAREQHGSGPGWSLWPNPASNRINLVTGMPSNAQVTILDAAGNEVEEFRVTGAMAGERVSHPISLAPGIYLVRVQPEDGSDPVAYNLKLVVQ